MLVSTLADLGFLVPADIDETSESVEGLIHDMCSTRGPSQLWFFVTEACNSQCTYCRQRVGGVSGVRSIDVESIIKVVDLFFATRNSNKPITVFFYGGEPLLAFDVVMAAHDAVQQRAVSMGIDSVQYNLFTNGYTLTRECAKWCHDHRIFVILSADAPPEVNQILRIPSSPSLNVDAALTRTVDLLHEYEIPFGISCVVAAHNAPLLPEIAEFFQTQWRPRNLHFIPAHRPPGSPPNIFVNNEFASKKIIEAFEVANTHGLYVENVMRRVRPFVEGRVKVADCGACGERIVLFPDGRIGPCEGSYHRDDMRIELSCKYADEHVFTQWRGRSPFNNTSCLSCQAISICGGGCPLDAIEHSGSITGHDERNCVITRILWGWLVDRVLSHYEGQEDLIELTPRNLTFLYGNVRECEDLPARAESFLGEMDRP